MIGIVTHLLQSLINEIEQVLLVDRVERLFDIDFYHVQSLSGQGMVENIISVSLNTPEKKKMDVKKHR